MELRHERKCLARDVSPWNSDPGPRLRTSFNDVEIEKKVDRSLRGISDEEGHHFLRAVCCDREKAARMLADKLALLNRKVWGDETALQYCVVENQIDAVRFLLQAGAHPSIADTSGRSAITDAVFGGKREMVALLLDHGVSVEAVNVTGETLLFIAAERGDTEMVTLLLERGANPNAPCPYTPLYAALYADSAEVMQLLLQVGADPHVPDLDGHALLDLAREEGKLECGAILQKALNRPK